MKVPLRVLLPAALALSSAVAAQPDSASCRAIWALVVESLPTARLSSEETPYLDGDGQCRLEDITLGLDDNQSALGVRSLRWSGAGLGALTAGSLPEHLSIEARGIFVWPLMPTAPALEYAMKVRARSNGPGMSVALDVERSAVPGEVQLSFDFDYPPGNRITIVSGVEGFVAENLTDLPQSVGGMRLKELDVVIETDGMFEQLFALSLGYPLIQDSNDPEARVEELKAESTALLGDLTGEFLTEDSRDALIVVVESMPHPRGTLELAYRSGPGFGAVRLLGAPRILGDDLDAEAVDALFAGDILRLIWTEKPPIEW